jgi:hypothetical protein
MKRTKSTPGRKPMRDEDKVKYARLAVREATYSTIKNNAKDNNQKIIDYIDDLINES